MYTALFIAVVVVSLAILIVRSKLQRRKQQVTVESYVTNIFSSQTYRPEVSSGFTYGIPSFILKFKTDEEKQHAISNGLTDKFLKNIQDLCAEIRPRGEAFESAQAVAIFSLEDEKRWAQGATVYRNPK